MPPHFPCQRADFAVVTTIHVAFAAALGIPCHLEVFERGSFEELRPNGVILLLRTYPSRSVSAITRPLMGRR